MQLKLRNLMAVISDGNCVNQSFFKMFDTVKLWRTKDNIFVLLGYIKLLKNIRNNWITETNEELELYIDGEKKIAQWADLKHLQRLEAKQILKLSKLIEM